MPALSFTKELAPLVESGEKRQTIRATRKTPIREGDRLYLYTGMRTKSCRKLREEVCREVLQITIKDWGVMLDGKILGPRQLESFAKADGFRSEPGRGTAWHNLLKFFNRFHSLPFEGVLIRW